MAAIGCGSTAPAPQVAEPETESLRDPAIPAPERPAARDRDRDQGSAFGERDVRWLEQREALREEMILRENSGVRRREPRERSVAESDMWSPCVKDYVRAQPERARRALTAALARYVTSCDADQRVVLERPFAGGRHRRAGSDVFLVGTFATDRRELALRITYCGDVRPRADRAVLVSDRTSWTSLPLVFDPDSAGCIAAQIPYTESLGRVVRKMIEGREASVRFEGPAQYEDITIGDEVRNDLRVMLDVVEALTDP